MDKKNIIEFKNLHTYFYTDKGVVRAVNGVSFAIPEGKTVAVVGESGSGKSVTALSLMGLVAKPQGKIVDGEILMDGQDITKFSKEKMREIRGRDLSMIFQEPMTSLNPSLRIGFQLEEIFHRILGLSKEESKKKSLELLEMVEIPNPKEKIRAFPHELSGGQKQRVMVAMALASKPKVLIADEPTTALDVTIQAEVLDLMKRLQQETGTSILLITHDLGVVAEMADEVVVMYGGRVVEKNDVFGIFDNPEHPYTQGLLKARPTLENRDQKLYNIPGNVPNPMDLGEECPFANRCTYVMDICRKQVPEEIVRDEDHRVSCFLYKEGLDGKSSIKS